MSKLTIRCRFISDFIIMADVLFGMPKESKRLGSINTLNVNLFNSKKFIDINPTSTHSYINVIRTNKAPINCHQ